jgi:hypothetical protein
VRKRHGPALVGPGVAATRVDDEDSEAGNGVRNGSRRQEWLSAEPPPAPREQDAGWIAAALIDPHFLQGCSHSGLSVACAMAMAMACT